MPSVADLVEQWTLLEIDFSTIYHLELDDNLHRPFRWFITKASGLLAQRHSLVRAYFRPDEGGA